MQISDNYLKFMKIFHLSILVFLIHCGIGSNTSSYTSTTTPSTLLSTTELQVEDEEYYDDQRSFYDHYRRRSKYRRKRPNVELGAFQGDNTEGQCRDVNEPCENASLNYGDNSAIQAACCAPYKCYQFKCFDSSVSGSVTGKLVGGEGASTQLTQSVPPVQEVTKIVGGTAGTAVSGVAVPAARGTVASTTSALPGNGDAPVREGPLNTKCEGSYEECAKGNGGDVAEGPSGQGQAGGLRLLQKLGA